MYFSYSINLKITDLIKKIVHMIKISIRTLLYKELQHIQICMKLFSILQ